MRDREDAPAPGTSAQARRVDASAQPGRDFTYAVLPPASAATGERRGGTRLRTRLRSGKLIGPDGQFLCECLIHNRSASGCRLKLPGPRDLPADLYLFDDQSGHLFQGRVKWRRETEMGLRLLPCAPTPLHRSIAAAMRQKFYALRR